MTALPHHAEAAWLPFPRGLRQPAGSFRFSADALLLASFLALPPGREGGNIADLGTGCGVVALAMLLRHPLARAVGMERQGPLAAAAAENARTLGLNERMQVLRGDLRLLCKGGGGKKPETSRPDTAQHANGSLSAVGEEATGEAADGVVPLHTARTRLANSCDLALANPPYRVLGNGRLPREGARREAFFGEADALDVFCRAAAFCLRDRGRFGVIFPAGRLPELCLALQGAGLRVRRILPVQALAGATARFVLMEAQKGSRGTAELLPPLALHARQEGKTVFTTEALAFCHWFNAAGTGEMALDVALHPSYLAQYKKRN